MRKGASSRVASNLATAVPGTGVLTGPSLVAVLVAAVGLGACGGAPGKRNTPPASEGIEAYVDSLRSDDPRAAYDLLAENVKATMSFDEFAKRWRETARERADQADALEEDLRGTSSFGERAKVVYQDGKSVYVLREGGQWRVESAMVSQIHAGRPVDAIRIFAEALSRRDYDGVMSILTERRRSGIGQQVDDFVSSLRGQLNAAEESPDRSVDVLIETTGDDRAELRWDDDGRRYRIVLRKEGDEWRIDDIHLRPAPPEPER